MAWMKVETSVARNRKFVNAGPAASWLWLCGLAYCKEGLTDGFIPDEAIEYLGVKNAKRLTQALVDAALWHRREGGWTVNDFLEHNKSAAEVAAVTTARAAGGKLGGRPKKNTSENLPETTKVSTKEPSDKPQGLTHQNLTENPEERRDRVEQGERGARAASPAPANAPARRASLVTNEHRNHAHCGRICLHASLFGEFVRRRNHPNADGEIRDWCMSVEAEWAEGGIHASDEPGDAFEFWKARYAERWPAASAASQKSSTPPQSAAANSRMATLLGSSRRPA